MTGGLRDRLTGLKRETHAVLLAARDPRTPWAAKAVAALVVAYALSPIDLIPDVIPVLGHLDDLVLVPLGLWLALKLIPPEVMADARAAARLAARRPSRSRGGMMMVVALWLAAALLTGWWLYPRAG